MSLVILDLIPALGCVGYAFQGYRRGAVTELLHIINFFFSYWIVRFLVGHLQKMIMALPVIGSTLESKAQELAAEISGMGVSSSFASSILGDGVYTLFGLILFAVLFFLISWGISAIINATQLVNRIPLVGLVNQILGALIGFVLCMFMWALLYHFVFWILVNIGLTGTASLVADSFFYKIF